MEEYNAGVRLTTAKFYSPNGKPYNHVGVEPDIRVPVAKLQLTARPVEGKLPGSGDACAERGDRGAHSDASGPFGNVSGHSNPGAKPCRMVFSQQLRGSTKCSR